MPVTSETLRIAAVFATMNRSETALQCVKALAAQTRPPEWVVVADNASTDDSASALEALTGLPFVLNVLRLPENLGNAGAVRKAMEMSYERGADAVWILDDDSWPQPPALAAMFDKPWDARVVRHPLQIDPKTGRFTWPLQVARTDGGWQLVDAPDDLPAGDFIRTRITWTGALVPREVRETVGPVMAELFIRGEDEEYPWRIEQAGFTQEAVRSSLMDHPGPENLIRIRLFGRHFFFERGLADWKLFYKVRNMVWLKRQQSGLCKALATASLYAAAVLFYEKPRRLGLILQAVWDGMTGRLGKWARHQ
jgi:rhamnopyranosyl-N-acetylglucosaminyl-diphospho-decaprenol beta-1,3/1,4-galactofuranosyltransferase